MTEIDPIMSLLESQHIQRIYRGLWDIPEIDIDKFDLQDQYSQDRFPTVIEDLQKGLKKIFYIDDFENHITERRKWKQELSKIDDGVFPFYQETSALRGNNIGGLTGAFNSLNRIIGRNPELDDLRPYVQAVRQTGLIDRLQSGTETEATVAELHQRSYDLLVALSEYNPNKR